MNFWKENQTNNTRQWKFESAQVWQKGKKVQAPVIQRLDNVIHRINRYPVDKC